jgi:hypothetical protein
MTVNDDKFVAIRVYRLSRKKRSFRHGYRVTEIKVDAGLLFAFDMAGVGLLFTFHSEVALPKSKGIDQTHPYIIEVIGNKGYD